MKAEPRVSRAIAEWQKKLLQLDRRNNLLYFREGRSAVRFRDVLPTRIDAWLDSTQRTCRFAELEDTGGKASRRTRVPRVATSLDEKELRRRLRALHRRDREWEEEQGLNVLFLAVGFLEWVDRDGETARSPLTLIPCDLERASPLAPWVLEREDDVPEANATLAHQLADFDIDIPRTIDGLAEYLESVREAITSKKDWSVTNDIWLATFAFSKMAMYEDLERMRSAGVDHPLVRQLAASEMESTPAVRGVTDSGPSPLPTDGDLHGGQLDDLLKVRDQFTVLDADFSQLRAIEAARSGRHVVIHGPPGTGKSQTIANLIATLLAEKRRVLFVSEKTAALDVVKRRLDECGLGVFCLDLHSERGKKESVYTQLQTALDDRRRLCESEFDEKRLSSLRNSLNAYVRALHRVRKPLNRTVYRVQGELAGILALPDVDFDVDDVAHLDENEMRQIEDAAGRIQRRGHEFRAHRTSRWIGLIADTSSMKLADEVKRDMDQATIALEQMPARVEEIARWMGVPPPATPLAAEAAAELLDHLSRGQGVPALWLQAGVLSRLQRRAQREEQRQGERRALTEVAQEAFGTDRPDVDFRVVARDLERVRRASAAMEGVLGPKWQARVVPDPRARLKEMERLAAAANAALRIQQRLHPLFPAENVTEPAGLARVVELGERALQLAPVPPAWFQPEGCQRAERVLGRLAQQAETLRRSEEWLFAECEPEVVEIVDRNMRDRFRRDYRRWAGIQRWGKAYRQDRDRVESTYLSSERSGFERLRKVVERTFELRRHRETWAASEEEFRELLGDRFDGRSTSPEKTRSDLEETAALAEELSDADTLQNLLTDGATRDSLCSIVPDARPALDRLTAAAAALGLNEPSTGLERPLERWRIDNLSSAAEQAVDPLETLVRAVAAFRSSFSVPPGDFTALSELTDDMIRLTEAERLDAEEAPKLRADLGERFTGPETDWSGIRSSLDWTRDALRAVAERPTKRFSEHLTDPCPKSEYVERSWRLRSIGEELAERLASALGRFDPVPPPSSDWKNTSFKALLAWTQDLSLHAPSVNGWLDYQDAVAELGARLGRGAVDRIRQVSEDAEQVPGIVRRRVWREWLDHVYRSDPDLWRFNARDHEDTREKFAQLDEEQFQANCTRVRARCFGRYPDRFSPQLGEIGILRGELAKKRRRMPVRRLIRRIPHVLQALKPCMLMSPLAVSQYLPRGELKIESVDFDAVIFDEASQVFPEDAVPAIARAGRVIVAGDEKQLPPTSFFRRTRDEEDDYSDGREDEEDEDEPDRMEGRESILAVMVGMVGSGVDEAFLTIHYRSKHDDLIRYSNHRFYGDRLLVFPAPEHGPTRLGVRDVYVPDGRFDAGASRTNRIEAERVVDLIFETMRSNPPDQSVGVVALSRAQADLIEQLVDNRRLHERQLDQRFDESQLERFFVKNLENVQGDERDHVILSIGYGPTSGSGAVPQRFGPINNEGGDRRLNVAVTRARRTMTVVRSLRPSDISENAKREGPRLLRRYLEYAADPKRALERSAFADTEAEPESPFEAAVIRQLIARGHRVDPQVGEAGYRIDLGIRSAEPNGYDLGIECDGARYHSAPAARDRDRLRQAVLEGLGWKIHRVWSTAWARDPNTEIAKIEESLARARSSTHTGSRRRAKREGDQNPSTQAPASDNSDKPPSHESPPALFEPYKETSLWNIWGVGDDPVTEHNRVMRRLVDRVLEVEGPVHSDLVVERIRQRYGLKRAGHRIRERIETELRRRDAGRIRMRLRGGRPVFFMKAGSEIVPRRPAQDTPKRKIEHIADIELEAGLLLLARKSFGCGEDELTTETARQFGFQRTGRVITDRLGRVVAGLRRRGRLRRRFGSLIAADP